MAGCGGRKRNIFVVFATRRCINLEVLQKSRGLGSSEVFGKSNKVARPYGHRELLFKCKAVNMRLC